MSQTPNEAESNVKTQTIDVSQITKRRSNKEEAPQGLFAARKKIFIREVKGQFNRWRWILVYLTQLAFYVTPWLMWNNRQAVLFDLTQRKFYLFGLVLWPSDVIYLAILLMICALALFLFTAVAGRLWCGYACPQTVYTEIFMWIERKIEGNRVAQMRLDKAPISAEKIAKKGSKHFLWLVFSLWSGFTLVGYYTPILELFNELTTLSFGPSEWFWMVFYGMMMYVFAGWMREQVCKYMCPYARFQSVMFDADTMIVTYDAKRGEGRGPRKKGSDYRAEGKGDCIDCGVCVDVCPTGIDIRNGLQYECIGCGACIDGCNEIMDKMGYPRNLVRYDTENGIEQGLSRSQLFRRIMRGRVLVYTGILAILIGSMAYSLGQRGVIKMTAERDSRSSARVLEDGTVVNIYRVQLDNADEKPHRVQISAHGMNSIALVGDGQMVLEPLSNKTAILKIQVNQDKARSAGGSAGSNSIEMRLKPLDVDEDTIVVPTKFLLPKQE